MGCEKQARPGNKTKIQLLSRQLSPDARRDQLFPLINLVRSCRRGLSCSRGSVLRGGRSRELHQTPVAKANRDSSGGGGFLEQTLSTHAPQGLAEGCHPLLARGCRLAAPRGQSWAPGCPPDRWTDGRTGGSLPPSPTRPDANEMLAGLSNPLLPPPRLPKPSPLPWGPQQRT